MDATATPTISSLGLTLNGGDSDINHIFIINHNFPAANLRVQYVDTGDVVRTLVSAGVPQNLTPAGTVTVTILGDSTLVTTENVVAAKQILMGTTVSGSPSSGSFFKVAQFIGTQDLGQLEGYPVVSNNRFDQNLSINKAASGRQMITKNVGGYSMRLSVAIWNIAADLALVQSLYDQFSGFLIWVNAGEESQFSNPVRGFRFEDIYFVKPTNSFSPVKYKGLYTAGYRIDIDVAESLN